MSTANKIANQLVKPLENAAIIYLGAKYVLGMDGRMDTLVGRYDVPMAFSLAGAASSVFTEAVHAWVLPEIQSNAVFNSTASMVLNPVLMATGLYSLLAVGDSVRIGNIGGAKIMALGAVSEIGASYVNDRLVQPYVQADYYYY